MAKHLKLYTKSPKNKTKTKFKEIIRMKLTYFKILKKNGEVIKTQINFKKRLQVLSFLTHKNRYIFLIK